MLNSSVVLTLGWRRQLGVTAPLVAMALVPAALVLARAWWWAPPYVALTTFTVWMADLPPAWVRIDASGVTYRRLFGGVGRVAWANVTALARTPAWMLKRHIWRSTLDGRLRRISPVGLL